MSKKQTKSLASFFLPMYRNFFQNFKAKGLDNSTLMFYFCGIFYFLLKLFFQDYNTDVFLRQRWHDPRLSHENMTEALDLADPYLVKAIWKPEVFFPNAKEANFQFVTVPNVLIRIHPDGEILYILR